ncbi:hypothetical protein BC829DRAFT_491523 [Chytridium lagenaria]|nr:hypothetical protein BC829DRAFT_491523 [Chytridium lagenaria]
MPRSSPKPATALSPTANSLRQTRRRNAGKEGPAQGNVNYRSGLGKTVPTGYHSPASSSSSSSCTILPSPTPSLSPDMIRAPTKKMTESFVRPPPSLSPLVKNTSGAESDSEVTLKDASSVASSSDSSSGVASVNRKRRSCRGSAAKGKAPAVVPYQTSPPSKRQGKTGLSSSSMSSSPSMAFDAHVYDMARVGSPPAKRGRSGMASAPRSICSNVLFRLPHHLPNCIDGFPQMRERSSQRKWQEGMIQNSGIYNVPKDLLDEDGDVVFSSSDDETLYSADFSGSYASPEIKNIVADGKFPNSEPTIMDKVYEELFGHELHDSPPRSASDDFQFVADGSSGCSPFDVSDASGWYGFNAYQSRGF